MLPPFDLSVPADDRYRGLAPDVAGKYAELAGCAAAGVTTVTTGVEKAAATLATVGEQIDVVFSSAPSEVVVTLHCGSESAIVRCPISR